MSTKELHKLPSSDQVRTIGKSVSVLDAILCQEWVHRYFSYDSKWNEGEELFSMRNGEGDEFLFLLQKNGAVVNGMAHEYWPKEKANLIKGLPERYAEFILGEPVNSIGTTFCIWEENSRNWEIGEISDFEDGSGLLLFILDGKPSTYATYAVDYFEDDSIREGNKMKVINEIYSGKILSKDMVMILNPGLADWKLLQKDLDEIDYPNSFS